MSYAINALTKSLNVFHAACSPCNNCDIEILDAITPRHDVERFGIQLVGSIRHADALLITGAMNRKSVPKMKRIYEQAPKPCVVIAVGQCSLSQHMFRDSYNVKEAL